MRVLPSQTASRGAQPYSCMPAIGNVTPTLGSVLLRTGRAEQLSCRAAPKKCSSQWVPPGLGCLKGYTPAAFSTFRGPLSLSALAAVRLGLQPCCDFCAGWAKGGGKEGAGLTQVRQGRKRPRGAAGNGTARQEHPGEAQPAPHPCFCSMGREGWGENQLIVPARVLPHGCSLQSLGQHLPP